jgi:hypothetical protein
MTRRGGEAPVQAVLAAALLLLLVGGAARAEPLKLDERGLGAVAAGAAGLLGPVDVTIDVSNPTDVAVNATTALGVLASGVAAAGFSEVGASLGLP